MKRSEMIELITSVHSDWQMITANETRPFPDVEFAEFLLENIENSGMLPPFNDWLYHMDGDKADSENIRYLSWEPEDED
jgi:hypothetical protein